MEATILDIDFLLAYYIRETTSVMLLLEFFGNGMCQKTLIIRGDFKRQTDLLLVKVLLKFYFLTTSCYCKGILLIQIAGFHLQC